MLSEFSNVVSKLALLINAGMILREAWADVAYTGNSVLYQEMQKTVEDMENGMSESDALFAFGMRCMIPEIKKFTSTLIQGIQKGNSNLAVMIQEQSKEVWNLKRQNVRRQGEKAASNLLIPIFLMFIGILIMVIVPVFTNLGM
jgi:tight adherence protein C